MLQDQVKIFLPYLQVTTTSTPFAIKREDFAAEEKTRERAQAIVILNTHLHALRFNLLTFIQVILFKL